MCCVVCGVTLAMCVGCYVVSSQRLFVLFVMNGAPCAMFVVR